jgi:hypothetical protein
MLPEGAILVWWAVKQQWIIDVAKKALRLPVFIGIPVEKQAMSGTSISDPVFAGVVWSLIFGNKLNIWKTSFRLNIGWFFESIIKAFKKILP